MPPRDADLSTTVKGTKEDVEITTQIIANLSHQLRRQRQVYYRTCQELLREQQKLISLLAQQPATTSQVE